MNRNKWKLNTVDIVLFSFAAAVIVILANVFFFGKVMIDVDKKETITLKILFNDVSEEHADLIKDNSSAYISGDEKLNGFISNTEIVQHPSYDEYSAADDENEDRRTIPSKDEMNVVAELQVEAIPKDGKYIIGGKEYGVGDIIDVYTASFGSRAKIISAEKSEG